MKNIYILISFIFIFNACGQKPTYNKKLKKVIDSINKIKIVQEYEADSIGNILDTLSTQIIKSDINNIEVYKENILYQDGEILISKNYYINNEDLFYSILESKKSGILSIYEAWSSNGKITNALSIEFKGKEKRDSLWFDYNYNYGNNEKLDEIIISGSYSDGAESKTVMTYNDTEKLISELLLFENDSLSFIKYHYDNDKIKTKSIYYPKRKTTINIQYDLNEQVKFEETYLHKNDSLIKIETIEHFSSKEGHRERTIYSDADSSRKKYIIYDIKYENVGNN